MNNKKIAFVFSNQIYYISSENDILTVTTVEGVICLRAAVETLTCNQDPFSALVLEIYQTLFFKSCCSVRCKRYSKQFATCIV